MATLRSMLRWWIHAPSRPMQRETCTSWNAAVTLCASCGLMERFTRLRDQAPRDSATDLRNRHSLPRRSTCAAIPTATSTLRTM